MIEDFFTFGDDSDDYSDITFAEKSGLPKCIEETTAFIAIREYMVHSYVYEKKSDCIIPDSEYDELCKWLLINWNWVKPYDINDYLEKSALHAGTGSKAANSICGLTLDYAEKRYKEYKDKRKKKK